MTNKSYLIGTFKFQEFVRRMSVSSSDADFSKFLGNLNLLDSQSILENKSLANARVLACCSRHVNSSIRNYWNLNFCLDYNRFKEILNASGSHKSLINCNIEKTDGNTRVNYVTRISPSNRFSNSNQNRVKRNLRMFYILHSDSPEKHLISISNSPASKIRLYLALIYIARRFKALVRKLSSVDDSKWQIAIHNMESQESYIIHSDLNVADPFLYEYENQTFLFYEQWANDEDGSIQCSRYDVESNNWILVGEVLDNNFHKSFPFLFTHEKSVYMIPQTDTSNKVLIYKCINFPLDWELFTEVSLPETIVDTVCFFVNDKWYFAGTCRDYDLGNIANRLRLFSTESIANKSWDEVPNSPLLWSDHGARNGGFIPLQNTNGFLRLGQIQGSDKYGHGLKAFYLEINNNGEFSHYPLNIDFETHGLSVHHMDAKSNWICIDFRKAY
jgi:hypothetical protein